MGDGTEGRAGCGGAEGQGRRRGGQTRPSSEIGRGESCDGTETEHVASDSPFTSFYRVRRGSSLPSPSSPSARSPTRSVPELTGPLARSPVGTLPGPVCPITLLLPLSPRCRSALSLSRPPPAWLLSAACPCVPARSAPPRMVFQPPRLHEPGHESPFLLCQKLPRPWLIVACHLLGQHRIHIFAPRETAAPHIHPLGKSLAADACTAKVLPGSQAVLAEHAAWRQEPDTQNFANEGACTAEWCIIRQVHASSDYVKLAQYIRYQSTICQIPRTAETCSCFRPIRRVARKRKIRAQTELEMLKMSSMSRR
ncbi:hypothetical protein C8Q79DRAFT_74655 [Trametes meyenii]|nr:hypothetical protein C8Q79DRAFT_74655 [Trametes meyenii]